MGIASIVSASTAFDPTGGANFEIGFSEPTSGLTASDFQRNPTTGGLNLNSGNSFRFTPQNSSEAGYLRILLPADSVTPNLDSDFDWTFYWGSDGVIHNGATDSVRSSRIRSSLNNVRWLSVRGTAGSSQRIELQFNESVSYLALGDISLGGDITSISSFDYHHTRQYYRGNVTLPSDLSGGGSFTLQIIDLETVYPGLGSSEEWTLRWDENGNLSTIRTSDLPVEVRLSLNTDYVSTSEEVWLTLHFSKNAFPPPINRISITDGMTIRAGSTINDRTWSYVLTAPPSGKGTGVISIPANVISPGNNAASISFTYIDEISAEISLSAASAQNNETIIAQFDFDYDVPNFQSSYVEANLPRNILALNESVILFNNNALAIFSDFDPLIGTAIALDEQHRSWSVPISLPQSGEGEIDIRLPENAIGFTQAEARAEAQFAPTINLNIHVRDNLTLKPVIHRDFRHNIKITGNNISTVDVQGLLRPFSHQWNSTTGTLSIIGRPERIYKDLDFTVIATDRTGTARKNAKIDVRYVAPAIKQPVGGLKFLSGIETSRLIRADNTPTAGSVKGTWFGLDHQITPSGIRLFGDLPEDMLGIESGNFTVDMENDGGKATTTTIPWNVNDVEDVYLITYDILNSQRTQGAIKLSSSGTQLWTNFMTGAIFLGARIDNDGNTYHLDSTNNRIRKMNPSGSITLNFTVPASSTLWFETDSENNLYFLTSARQILKYNSSGVRQWTYSIPAGSYSNRAFLDQNNNIYIFFTSNRRLSKIDSSGNLEWNYTAPSGNYQNFLIRVDSAGNVYLFNEQTDDLYKLNSSGVRQWTYNAQTGNYDRFILSGDEVCLFNETNDHMYKISAEGLLLWELEDLPPNNSYSNLSKDIDENIYIVNFTTDTVYKIDSEGTSLWNSKFGDFDLAIDSATNVYVSSDFFVKKISSLGSDLWTYRYTGNNTTVLASILLA